MASDPSGVELLKPSSRLVITGDDLRLRAIGYAENLVRSYVVAAFPACATFGAVKVSLSEALSGGVRRLSIDAPAQGIGTAGGWLMNYDTASANAPGAVVDCPYPRAAGVTYYIGLRKSDLPVRARAGGGVLSVPVWQSAFGESGAPGVVTDNGNGTMRLELSVAMRNRTCGGVWPSNATAYRRCCVWLADPSNGTVDRCLYLDGQLKSNGAVVYVDVPHTFGQRSASVAPADYVVAVEGLAVSTTNLAGETDDADNPAYWLLGAVVDGVFDLSAQRLLSAPGVNVLDVAQVAADVYDVPSLDGDGAANLTEPLQQTVRMLRHDIDQWLVQGLQAPCAYIPGVAETYDWSTGYSIVDDGAQRRITYPALPVDSVVWTGDTNGTVRACGSLSAEYVDFLESNGAGTYVVYLEAETTNAAPGAESVTARLKVATSAAFAAIAATRLELMRFDWDGIATLTNDEPADLWRHRRPRPESESSLALYDAAGGSVVTLTVGTVAARPAFRVSPYANGVPVNGAAANVALRLRRVGGNIESAFYGGAGEDDGAGSGNFTTDYHDQAFGGYSDWNWRYDATRVHLGSQQYPATGNYLEIVKTGGAQVDANGYGVKPVVGVSDLKLLGTGKVVEVSLPLGQGVATMGNAGDWWYANAGLPPMTTPLALWRATGGGNALMFEAPHRVGEALLGFRVTGWVGGGDPLDTMTATIQRLDSDSATGALTQETLNAGDSTWDGINDATPTTKTLTLATPVLGTTTDRWFLQVFTVLNAAPEFGISHVVARYLVAEI